MARKPSLSHGALVSLGAEKLAVLLMDEAGVNSALRKRLNAAVAGGDGPDALIKVIDRHLAALERERAMVSWQAERVFAQDLDALVASITRELAPLDSWRAVRLLLRFIDSHVTVFERIDDSNGRIQDVYARACEAVPALVERLPLAERAQLSTLVTTSLARDTHGLATGIAEAIVPLLPEGALAAWDAVLAGMDGMDRGPVDVIGIRMAIADARADLDGYLALEARRPDWRQNPLAAAERLLAAGRLEEALDWARRERRTSGPTISTAYGWRRASWRPRPTAPPPRPCVDPRLKPLWMPAFCASTSPSWAISRNSTPWIRRSTWRRVARTLLPPWPS